MKYQVGYTHKKSSIKNINNIHEFARVFLNKAYQVDVCLSSEEPGKKTYTLAEARKIMLLFRATTSYKFFIKIFEVL